MRWIPGFRDSNDWKRSFGDEMRSTGCDIQRAAFERKTAYLSQEGLIRISIGSY